jgi:hypothetical protein
MQEYYITFFAYKMTLISYGELVINMYSSVYSTVSESSQVAPFHNC